MRFHVPHAQEVEATVPREGSKGKRIILVRHASSTRAQVGIWGRQFDAPLADGFEEQLARTKSALKRLDQPAVFSSPLIRCVQTARFLFPKRKFRVVDELKAYHSGSLEGVTEEFIRANHPPYLTRSYRNRFLLPEFGEESLADQSRRVARGLFGVLNEKSGTKVLVAHYSSINIVAHLISRNSEISTYGDGTYDLSEGGYIDLALDSVAVADDLAKRYGLRLTEPTDYETGTR